MIAAAPQTNTPITSTQYEMDVALKTLYAAKDLWVQTDVYERIRLIDACIASLREVIPQWVEANQQAKQIPSNHPGAADDWTFMTVAFRQLNLLRASLTEIADGGLPSAVGAFTARPDDRLSVKVFPKGVKESLTYGTISGEIWFNSGLTESEVRAGQAKIYRNKSHAGRVALVLGAGNMPGLIPGDFIYKLFAEDQVVALKVNPVNAYMGPIIEAGYAPLVERGFLQVLYGG
ncbi:MAG: hypothetical protein AAF125_18685, partial [Chloroflexota bacterium]